MKNDNKTAKLLIDTLKAGMTKFVGDAAHKDTAKEMKTHMTNVLIATSSALDLNAPLPGVEVTVDGSQATFSFTDPKTSESIEISTWISRTVEGFYD